MNIYFAGSIRGGREDMVLYQNMIGFLQKYGEVLTEHIGDPNLTDTGEKNLSDAQIHDRDMSWLNESDLIVAEVSTPSLGVGYEIGRAIESGKKIICLYREGSTNQLSAMVSGCPNLHLIKYTGFDDFKKHIVTFLTSGI